MERRFRSRYGRAAVVRAALVVFLLAGALIGAVVFTLDLNARRSNRQEVATELAGMARVSSSTFATMRANLRARVGDPDARARGAGPRAGRTCDRRRTDRCERRSAARPVEVRFGCVRGEVCGCQRGRCDRARTRTPIRRRRARERLPAQAPLRG